MTELLDAISSNLDAVVLVFLSLLAAVFALFPAGRALVMGYLMLRVRREWFPEGRFVLVCTMDDEDWLSFSQDVVLPAVGEHAVVVKCPGGRPGRGAPLAERLTWAFNHAGRKGPLAIVFKPYFEHEKIYFGDALESLRQGDDRELRKNAKRLAELVGQLKERMLVYI